MINSEYNLKKDSEDKFYKEFDKPMSVVDYMKGKGLTNKETRIFFLLKIFYNIN